MTAAVEFQGLRELMRNLERFGVAVADMKDGMQRVGQIIVDEAGEQAEQFAEPTGLLAGTIRATRTKNKVAIRAGNAKAPYAGVIHFGWDAHNIEAQPFIYDAMDIKRLEVVSEFNHEINHLIRKAGLS